MSSWETIRRLIAVGALFAVRHRIFGSGRRFDLLRTSANRQPAFGAYLCAPTGIRHGTRPHRPHRPPNRRHDLFRRYRAPLVRDTAISPEPIAGFRKNRKKLGKPGRENLDTRFPGLFIPVFGVPLCDYSFTTSTAFTVSSRRPRLSASLNFSRAISSASSLL
jgi:hypothetical protein